MEPVELKARLTLEDDSAPKAKKAEDAFEHLHETFEHVEHGAEHLHEKIADVGRDLAGFARDAAAVTVGFELGGLLENFKEIGHEAFEAANAVSDQQNEMSGVLAMSGKADQSFYELDKTAGMVRESIEGIAAQTGQSTQMMIEGFASVSEHTNLSNDAVLNLTESMAYAGRAVPGGFNAVAEGLQAIELGAVRARNPIVQLIRESGMIKGTSKEIAKELNGLAQTGHIDQAINLATQAIDKMGSKMRNVEPSFGELLGSITTIREQLYQAAGAPLLKAISPEFERLKNYLIENRDEIAKYAENLGEHVGEWVTEAGEEVRTGFQYLETHADEIEAAIKSGAHEAKEVVDFILAHREAIAIAFGAKTAVGGAAQVFGAAKGVYGAAKGGYEVYKNRGEIADKTVDFAKGAAEWIAKIGGAGGAALKAKSALEALGGGAEAAAASAATGSAEAATAAVATAGGLGVAGAAALALGVAGAAVGASFLAAKQGIGLYDDLQRDAASDLGLFKDKLNDMTEGYGENAQVTAEVNAQWRDLAANGDDAKEALLETAIAAHEAASGLMSIAALHDPKRLPGYDATEAFLMTPPSIDLNNAVRQAAAKSLNVNLNGGQKFEIKQDFRDEDPDDIATIFKRDVGRTATNRLQSGYSTPFT